MAGLLFNDIFKVKCVNPDGKKYDKVSRIEARSEKLSMHMLLDVNTEIYPIDEGEKLLMVLSPTLNYDGSPVTSYKDQGGLCIFWRTPNAVEGRSHPLCQIQGGSEHVFAPSKTHIKHTNL
ncbi:DNA-directed RNA polymerases II, IV and V subunit 8B isoform X2 [Cucumis sativus]|uniref:DNA-directed RNA polymerases II, IV and V subunit 8B-like isoform X2 n=1 Tax=Cucumis sativus TaxID=3659 RepID=UPI0012F508D3|nr:DNA-directed RNA polymerases II, IV and V subunit 8B-like isoform X2 [Cucumis sativus]XP_031745817.1 DNA-directed RNA polymerases II, IV and V subunit 8B isoform X2 [Cucumis sativus]